MLALFSADTALRNRGLNFVWGILDKVAHFLLPFHYARDTTPFWHLWPTVTAESNCRCPIQHLTQLLASVH